MKNLWDRTAEAFRALEPGSGAADGYGGVSARFSEGAVFRGAAVPSNRGEADGGPVTLPGGRYRLTAEAGAPIGYGSYVRRLSDGAVFRICGEVLRAPDSASFGMLAADAERIGDLPPTRTRTDPESDHEETEAGA